MTDHDAEMDADLDQLEAADLVEQFVNEDGMPAMRSWRPCQETMSGSGAFMAQA